MTYFGHGDRVSRQHQLGERSDSNAGSVHQGAACARLCWTNASWSFVGNGSASQGPGRQGLLSIKHFVDLVVDIPKNTIDIPSLQAVFRDKAWEIRPYCHMESQYFLLPQDDDHLILLKHVHIIDDKVSGSYVQSLLRAQARE